MKVYDKDITKIDEPLAIAIGFFDGVHQGHQCLLNQVIETAKMRSLTSAVVTFVEHPRKVLDEDFQPALLNGYDEKLRLLEKTGIEYCIPLHFTKELSQITAEEFMGVMLKEKFNVNTLIIGYDHRFGFERADGFAQYIKYGREIEMTVIQAQELDTGTYVSSSHIRDLLKKGEVENAAKLLTYNYVIEGKVGEGYKIGRTIGYPTANIKPTEKFKIIPAEGIYVVYVYIDGQRHQGMLYIGKRPTMANAHDVSIEVHILDFDEDIYGKEVMVELLTFLRRDAKFMSLEILKRQLAFDEERTREYFEQLDKKN